MLNFSRNMPPRESWPTWLDQATGLVCLWEKVRLGVTGGKNMALCFGFFAGVEGKKSTRGKKILPCMRMGNTGACPHTVMHVAPSHAADIRANRMQSESRHNP